jgi:hypothetical protein
MLRGSTKWTLERFLARTVTLPSGCMEWTGYRDARGYGQTHYRGPPIRTHRLSWILHFGPIPDGEDVCHRCDNPPCVNPGHLFTGSAYDNVIDMRTKGRHGTAKITQEIANEIRRRAEAETQTAIAADIGLSQAHVSDIVRGRSWGTTARAQMPRSTRHPLAADAVHEIRRRYDAWEPSTVIAKDFSITRYQVANIGKRKQWKNVPEASHAASTTREVPSEITPKRP